MNTYENTLTQFKVMLSEFGLISPQGERDIEFYSMFFPPEKVKQIPLSESQRHYRDSTLSIREVTSLQMFKTKADGNQWFSAFIDLARLFLGKLETNNKVKMAALEILTELY